MQLSQPWKKKTKANRGGFSPPGGMLDPAPVAGSRAPFHHFDPAVTLCLLLGGLAGASRTCPAIINSVLTPTPPHPQVLAWGGLLRLETREAARQADPAVGMHSAAGRLHSASTVRPSPCQPPGPAGKTKEKLFPCCLATAGNPSSGSEGEQRERAEERKKKTYLDRLFCCNLPN